MSLWLSSTALIGQAPVGDAKNKKKKTPSYVLCTVVSWLHRSLLRSVSRRLHTRRAQWVLAPWILTELRHLWGKGVSEWDVPLQKRRKMSFSKSIRTILSILFAWGAQTKSDVLSLQKKKKNGDARTLPLNDALLSCFFSLSSFLFPLFGTT